MNSYNSQNIPEHLDRFYMIQDKPIFPEIKFDEFYDENIKATIYQTFTFLRKFYNGSWYLIPIRERCISLSSKNRKEREELKLEHTHDFYQSVYLTKELYKVNPNLKDSFGILLNPIDDSQLSEHDRLKKLILNE